MQSISNQKTTAEPSQHQGGGAVGIVTSTYQQIFFLHLAEHTMYLKIKFSTGTSLLLVVREN